MGAGQFIHEKVRHVHPQGWVLLMFLISKRKIPVAACFQLNSYENMGDWGEHTFSRGYMHYTVTTFMTFFYNFLIVLLISSFSILSHVKV